MSDLETTEREEFHIDNEERANWLLRKLANLDAELARIEAQFKTRKSQLESDRTFLFNRFGGELEAWASTQIAQRGGRRKSLPLLQGTVGFRKVPAGLRLSDEATALQWASEHHPELITHTPRLSTKDYLESAERALEETGELWEGITLQEEEERFSIRFGKEAKE